MQTKTGHIPPMSTTPAGFSAETDLPKGFVEFYQPLHEAFTPRQQAATAARRAVLEASQQGRKPQYPAPSAAQGDWRIDLPNWTADQRNQMTGPADDAELGVKMLNSGAPGVMLDLEDSVANAWPNINQGIANIIASLRGELTYQDRKRDREVAINESKTVILTRPRGLH